MNKKKVIKYLILIFLVPLTVILGAILFDEKKQIWIALSVAVMSCIPFFMTFEKKEVSAERLVVLAVMVALSVAGRFAFSFVPHFKPITALVIITGMYLGAESGFLCGALSALISNFIFGQGPWTPFQMFSWGLIGFVAAILSGAMKKSKIILSVYGALSGVVYSLIMDVMSALVFEEGFNFARYLSFVITSLPVSAVYAVSNIIFLLLLARPIGEKMDRLKTKYGI